MKTNPGPEDVIKFLEILCPKLVSSLERDCIRATIQAVKRLAQNPQAVAWWQPQLRPQGLMNPPRLPHRTHAYNCTQCQQTHYAGSQIYTQHLRFQDKFGISLVIAPDQDTECPLCGSPTFDGCPGCEDYL